MATLSLIWNRLLLLKITCCEQVTYTFPPVFFLNYYVLYNRGYDIHLASSD